MGNTTTTAPRDHVEKLFDGYAQKFDASLIKKLDYQIPKSLSKMVMSSKHDDSLGNILDLGCGTGLLGVELNQYCKNIEGIDLSNCMLDQAKKTRS